MEKAIEFSKETLSEKLSHALEEAGELSERESAALAAWLARCGHSEGLRVLALRGSLGPAQDELGMDLLAWAARGGDEECILLAGEMCLGGAVDVWGGGALHHWAEKKAGGPGVGAQILLALGSGPVARDCWGMLPMHWCGDPGVWSWSMAALWANGEPEGWLWCSGGSAPEAMGAAGIHGLREWEARQARAPLAGRRRRQAQAPRAPSREILEDLLTGMEIRRKKILGAEAAQNCVARQLGIE